VEFKYDDGFVLPAPVVGLTVQSPGGGSEVHVIMFIDSGSDITVLPATAIESLRLVPADYAGVGGVSSQVELAPLYAVRMRLEELEIENTLVVGWTGTYGLLGRDLLNRWRVTLDGPAQTVRIDAT
jgi:predicted aspartyl protease